MTDRPILFSAPMVRGLLAGRKTQTRRVAKNTTLPHLRRPGDLHVTEGAGMLIKNNYFRVPYAVGDHLWVREAWRTESRAYDDLPPTDMGGEETIIFEANAEWKQNRSVGRLRQGMHMPRWASRLTLTVTSVQVQRLQEISEADAVAEGITYDTHDDGRVIFPIPGNENYANTAKGAYRQLWNHLNEARGFGWDTNPWVVAITFSAERRNIDNP